MQGGRRQQVGVVRRHPQRAAAQGPQGWYTSILTPYRIMACTTAWAATYQLVASQATMVQYMLLHLCLHLKSCLHDEPSQRADIEQSFDVDGVSTSNVIGVR